MAKKCVKKDQMINDIELSKNVVFISGLLVFFSVVLCCKITFEACPIDQLSKN